MKKIRIGKDMVLRWAILTNGEPEPLQGRDLKLVVLDPLRRKIMITDFSTDGHILSFRFLGTEQKSLGKYSLTLWENFGKVDMTAVDACNVFELVSTTCQEPTADMESETVEWQSNIQIGIKGASAYELAVSHGFEGTEEDWLASLKGDKGDAFTYGDFTPEQITELQKPAADVAKLAADAANSANQATTQATQAATQANDAAQSANQAAQSADDAAQSIARLEQTIGQNEQSRISTEQSRVSAETERQQVELSRVSAEKSRASAETTREQQEQSRQSAEDQRVNEFNELKQLSETATNNANQAAQSANSAAENANSAASDINKKINELNISALYPTSGIDGSNRYDLAGAIAQVPTQYRNIQGLKITFINNETSKSETWKYNGGTFTTTTNWVQGDGSGGNLILAWNTDVATTRKQVLQQERKKLLQISYTNASGGTVNEQYIGTSFTDTEWVKDSNWSIIAGEEQLTDIQYGQYIDIVSGELTEYTGMSNTGEFISSVYTIYRYSINKNTIYRASTLPSTSLTNQRGVIVAKSSDGSFTEVLAKGTGVKQEYVINYENKNADYLYIVVDADNVQNTKVGTCTIGLNTLKTEVEYLDDNTYKKSDIDEFLEGKIEQEISGNLTDYTGMSNTGEFISATYKIYEYDITVGQLYKISTYPNTAVSNQRGLIVAKSSDGDYTEVIAVGTGVKQKYEVLYKNKNADKLYVGYYNNPEPIFVGEYIRGINSRIDKVQEDINTLSNNVYNKEYIDGIKNELDSINIDEIKSSLNFSEYSISDLEQNAYYPLNYPADKPKIPEETVPLTEWGGIVFEVNVGDIIQVQTIGGVNGRAYALAGNDRVIYQIAEQNENTIETPKILVAEKDGYACVNCNKLSESRFKVVKRPNLDAMYNNLLYIIEENKLKAEKELIISPTYHNNPLPIGKDEIRILGIGNSYLDDATAYLSDIINASGIDKSKLVMYTAVLSGYSLEQWLDIYNTNESVVIRKVTGNLSVSITSGTLSEILSQDWDIITLQQNSINAPTYSTFNPYLNQLIRAIRLHCPNQRVCLAFQLVWRYWVNYGYVPAGEARWIANCNAVKEQIMRNGIDIIIPTGTTIENARNTSLNTEHDLTRDGTHLCYGVGRYIAGCTWFQTIFAPLFNISVLGNSAIHTVTDGEKNDSTFEYVDVTDENKELCQLCAVLACYNMYELSDIIEYPSNLGNLE